MSPQLAELEADAAYSKAKSGLWDAKGGENIDLVKKLWTFSGVAKYDQLLAGVTWCWETLRNIRLKFNYV